MALPVFRDFYRERRKLSKRHRAPWDRSRAQITAVPAGHRVRESCRTRNPVLGWRADVEDLRPADAKAFLDTYGGPGNTHRVHRRRCRPGRRPNASPNDISAPFRRRRIRGRWNLQEAPQAGPKTVAIWSDRSAAVDDRLQTSRPKRTRRDPALDVVATILGDKHTGWLRKELVEERRLAQSVEAIANFPSGRYVSLFVLSAVPNQDHTVEENRQSDRRVAGALAVEARRSGNAGPRQEHPARAVRPDVRQQPRAGRPSAACLRELRRLA